MKMIVKKKSQQKQNEEFSLPQALTLASAVGEIIMPEPYSSAFGLSRQIGEKHPQAGAWISGITLGILIWDSIRKSNHTELLSNQSHFNGQFMNSPLHKTRL